ncbi:YjbF family lipoprotein [Parasalinivibrio latis]|uniref:YjbF family lipoprotein n=1 Tax=Parasalinivibrio latis TaxID=2952610 RepID=UPI0030E1DBB2
MSLIYRQIQSFLLLVALFILPGCSQTSSDLSDSFSLALFGTKDIAVPAERIKTLPYASIYVRQGSGPRVFMVLGWAEGRDSRRSPQLKWLSAGEEMIVTEAGRIVKTVNLGNGNLSATYAEQPDPLSLGLLKNTTPLTWQHTLNWQPGYHFGYSAISTFEKKGNESILINGHSTDLLRFDEQVFIPSLDVTYTNSYWLNPQSGEVVSSQQTPAPGMDVIKMTILKPFA